VIVARALRVIARMRRADLSAPRVVPLSDGRLTPAPLCEDPARQIEVPRLAPGSERQVPIPVFVDAPPGLHGP
jgi:hypothetical protein